MTPSRGTPDRATEAKEPISELTTARLSIYLRCLSRLEATGVPTVSSKELARRFHLNSAQIRKDLACLGEFGIRGVGYEVRELREHLVRSLGIDRPRKLVIIGAGNLGMALADYGGFNTDGFRVVALFDSDPARVGLSSRSGVEVHATSDLPRFAAETKIDIAIIAVPAEAAQRVYDTLVEAGIAAVLNFAPAVIRAHDHVKVRNVDLRINLESLSFHLKSHEQPAPDSFPRAT
jgi:redox-sensing transcriptional repressor